MFKANINDLTRQAWVSNTLKKIAKGKILDVGAGELKNKPYCSHLEYVSQDFCQYDGNGDQKGLQSSGWDTIRIDIISDITSIPVNDESFDYILCTEVFEHIKYPVKAVEEFYRILKPGGGNYNRSFLLSYSHGSLSHVQWF